MGKDEGVTLRTMPSMMGARGMIDGLAGWLREHEREGREVVVVRGRQGWRVCEGGRKRGRSAPVPARREPPLG